MSSARRLVQPEMPHQRALDVGVLLRAELAIGVRQLEQQRTRRQLDPAEASVCGRLSRRGRAADQALTDETTYAIEHRPSRFFS